jgi:hypothetical protein
MHKNGGQQDNKIGIGCNQVDKKWGLLGCDQSDKIGIR